MDNLEKINQIPFLDLFSRLWLQTQKDTTINEYRLQIPGESRISNGSYKVNTLKNVVYANWSTRPQWTVFSFMQMYLSATNDRDVFQWFEDNYQIRSVLDKTKKKWNTPKKDLLHKFDDFIIEKNWSEQILWAIRTWLVHRGFDHDFVNSQEGTDRIVKVFWKLWFCESPATKTKWKDSKEWFASKPVIMFPAYDQNGIQIGCKMRKVNNLPEDEDSKDSKSINITWAQSGVIFDSLETIQKAKQLIIVEWEPDYIVLRMLGFDNVIGNLGWVLACKEIIRDLVKMTNSVIVAYDNDAAGKDGARRLAEFCKREMFYVKYVDRKNVHGEKYKDINEFFEAGFRKDDFENMLKNSTEIKIEDDGRWDYDSNDSKVLLTMSNENPFIYLRKNYEYYDIYENRIVKKEAVTDWMGIKGDELKEMLNDGSIKKYYDVCYWKGGRKDHYNVLDERIILQPSKNPVLHEDIKFLISNLCGGKKKNIDWLNQAILYKYTHINDVLVPAVLFKWVGGSGKGTFIKLLSKIFSNENVMCGLGTNSLTSDFCPYTGNKIIVEINELWWGNHKDAVKILDKLKSMIFEPKIMVNMKGIQPREWDNIAWFILSSNHQKPLKLDAWSSGNRRFTIINTGDGIVLDKGKKINETISNVENVQDYLAWLFETYPDIPTAQGITALENEDKELLTDQSESFVDKYFTWLNDVFPKINKISIKERNTTLSLYRDDIWENDQGFDKKYSYEYFNNWLPHHVSSKKVSIRGKTKHGYFIQKEIPDGETWYFDNDRYETGVAQIEMEYTDITK